VKPRGSGPGPDTGQSPPEDATTDGHTRRPAITVATWNLWWRFGDWAARLPAIHAVLAQLDADVLGLQEVWAAGGRNAAAILAEELGMEWTWAASPHPEHWQRRLQDGAERAEVGNAILSRWPILESAAVDLPHTEARNLGNTALAASIAAPGGTLYFATTQLDSHPAASAARVEQVSTLARMVDSAPATTFPPVVTGDFNAVAESDEMRLLEGHLTAPVVPGQVLVNAWRYATPYDHGPTWDPRNPHVAATGEPAARIDHILVGLPTEGGTGRVVDVARFGTRPERGVWPSDHAGVAARLAAPGPAPERAPAEP
jgi:endonuclease/exonuclease/phosphatase family metal-dependent hydrolase